MRLNKKNISFIFIGMIILIIAFVFFSTSTKSTENVAYIHNEGKAQGTYYSATYLQPEGKDLQAEIEILFNKLDLSLSTYNPNSIISKINQNNDSILTDLYFETMFEAAQDVSEHSNGAFDITVAPLVNAWGFGSKNINNDKNPDISKILPNIGFKKIKILNHKLIKQNPAIMIDANGIAQGYSADLVAKLFEKNACQNYLIDIGGEIVCKGLNPDGKLWRIGIDKPLDDPENENGELQTIVSITNASITTSGNYRKFYYKNNKKYAHTINPKTGYPVEHNLLSATVIAPTCILADAYATAFMVIGLDSALLLCKSIPKMECYLIYSNNKGEFKVKYTEGFKKYLTE